MLQFLVFNLLKTGVCSLFFTGISASSIFINAIPRLGVRYSYFKYVI